MVRAMLRRTAFAALCALVAGRALAAGGKEKDKDEKGDIGQYVDLQPVGLPIVAKGQLINYVFVYVRLNLNSSANAARLREREPYFRDALVRASHRTPFTLAADYNKVDVPRLTSTLYREASAIAGPGQIRSVVITSQQPRRRISPARA